MILQEHHLLTRRKSRNQRNLNPEMAGKEKKEEVSQLQTEICFEPI